MRIISGYAGGRRLVTPNNDQIRPTIDRVREALFSILGDVHGLHVVDGFAGTGALGCEALSRGASTCAFFDSSREAISLVKQNVEMLAASERVLIKKCPFKRGLTLLKDEPDLIFLDPPYAQPLVAERAFEAMRSCPLITQGALVVLEQDSEDELPEENGFALEDTRTYGRVRLTFWRREASDSASASPLSS